MKQVNNKTTQLSQSFHNIIYGGVAVEAMNTFATGPFLIAYALLFNANNIQIGFLGSIVYIGYIMHLFAAWLLERKYSPKKISIVSGLISRPCYLLTALLAFWASTPHSVYLLLLCFSLTYLCGGIAGGAWYPWMKELIPGRIMGRFFASRMKYMMLAQMICSGIGALLIYYFQHYHANQIIFSYSILLTFSFLVGMYSVYTFTKIKDTQVVLQENLAFSKKLAMSLKNKTVRRIMINLSLLNFSICFVTPFFSAFMLKFLSYSTPLVILYTCVSQIAYILSSRYWGKMTDKKSCIVTLMKGLSAFVTSILCFGITIYTCPALSYIILFFTHILLGFATFALKLVLNNIPLKYVPKKDAPVYISVINVSKSFAAVISGICAGAILSFLERRFAIISDTPNLSWTTFWLIGIMLCIITIQRSRKL